MGVAMRLGDLLIRARLVTPEQVAQCLELQGLNGGRLGDHLVAIGAITRHGLDSFLHRTPAEPENVAATGIDDNELLTLLIKLIYSGRLESGQNFADAMKLPYHVIMELVRNAAERKLVYSRGVCPDNRSDMLYALTEEGQRWAAAAMQRSQYTGPAPVTLEEFTQQVSLQKLTNEGITFDRVKATMGELALEDHLLEQCGPALNTGRAMLLYGPPGNGKTTFALKLANVFTDLIYVPYAIMVEGQVIRVFDPSIHIPIVAPPPDEQGDDDLFIRVREEFDARWVPCKRPFVVAGGELTLEMLDLRYDPASNFYEAPLHVKALGGCFVIDDFGRQLVTPTILLNRWIVPLESRIDFLKLHTGKSFSIPFEELVMFSTNLAPEDLMDPAFLRRLPYKVEIGPPNVANYRKIFNQECARHNITLDDAAFDAILHKIRGEKGLDLAAYQPKFIMDQVAASCRFRGYPPRLEPRFVAYAIDNLRPKRPGDPA